MRSVQFSSFPQLCLTLCDHTVCSTPGFPVHHQLPELTQTHVRWVGDTIQPSHPLSSPSPALNLSQHQHFTSGGQNTGVSASTWVLPMNTQDWSPLVWTGEGWVPKNWCFWTVVLEKTLENPLDCKEIQPVPPKGHQSWVFIGGTDVEVETPILWPPDAKSWLVWKDPDVGEDWRQKEKGTTEDEMVRWHHQLPGLTQTHVHCVGDAIQPSHPLSSPSPPAFNLPQHQGLFKWVSSLHQVAKILGVSAPTPRTDFL